MEIHVSVKFLRDVKQEVLEGFTFKGTNSLGTSPKKRYANRRVCLVFYLRILPESTV